MSDVKQEVETAVKQEAVAVESKVVAFVRANALKAIGFSAVVGAVVGHIV